MAGHKDKCAYTQEIRIYIYVYIRRYIGTTNEPYIIRSCRRRRRRRSSRTLYKSKNYSTVWYIIIIIIVIILRTPYGGKTRAIIVLKYNTQYKTVSHCTPV